MATFWEGAFLRPGAPDLAARVWYAIQQTMSMMLLGALDPYRWGSIVMLGVSAQTMVSAAACLVGLVVISVRGRVPTALLLAGPIAAAVFASSLNSYAIAARFLLFCIPFMFILMSVGIRASESRAQSGPPEDPRHLSDGPPASGSGHGAGPLSHPLL